MKPDTKFLRPADLMALFPKDAVSVSALEKAVEEHGTYHRIGKTIFLTDTDVRDFVDRLAGRRAQPLVPTDDEAGLIVYIGSPTTVNGEDCSVWVGWSPIGQELALLDQVRLGAQEHVMILESDHMTYGEVEKWKKEHKRSRFYGSWYRRDDEVMAVALAAKAKAEGTYDDE